MPVLLNRGRGVDDGAIHVEKQSGEIDHLGGRREVVVFVVRHFRCVWYYVLLSSA